MQHTRFLRYVDAVARAGSIRAAAQRLHVAASAVNRRIQDLEDELGTALFERTARGVRLTAAGELFVAHARRCAADLERVQSEIESLQGVRRGTIAIAGSQAVATAFLPQAIVDFGQAHPGVSFDVKVLDRDMAVHAVMSFEVDLAVVLSPPPTRGFQVLAQCSQRTCALVAPDHPLAGRASLRFKDCLAYPLALPDASLSGRALLEDLLERSSAQPVVQLSSNSFEMMRNFARQAHGVCFQVRVGAGPETGLVAIPLEDRGLPSGRLVLGAQRGRVLPVGAALFAEFVADRMAALAA